MHARVSGGGRGERGRGDAGAVSAGSRGGRSLQSIERAGGACVPGRDSGSVTQPGGGAVRGELGLGVVSRHGVVAPAAFDLHFEGIGSGACERLCRSDAHGVSRESTVHAGVAGAPRNDVSDRSDAQR